LVFIVVSADAVDSIAIFFPADSSSNVITGEESRRAATVKKRRSPLVSFKIRFDPFPTPFPCQVIEVLCHSQCSTRCRSRTTDKNKTNQPNYVEVATKKFPTCPHGKLHTRHLFQPHQSLQPHRALAEHSRSARTLARSRPEARH